MSSSRSAPHRKTLTVICAVVTTIILVLHLTEERYNRAEQAGRDWLTTNAGARQSVQNPRLLFLGIDDASKNLDRLFAADGDLERERALQLMKEPFPWSREVYAHIAQRLIDAGATVVIFDMLFPVERDSDGPFREALVKYGDKIVIGANLKDSAADIDDDRTAVTSSQTYVMPAASLVPSRQQNDPLFGFVNVKVDSDKLVRRFIYRTSVLEFYGKSPSKDTPELLSLSAQALVKVGLGALVPREHQAIRLRFADEILPRSLHEIFVKNIWEAPPYNKGTLFRDKIVLIGAAGNEAEDRLQTPSGTVLGPSIHLSAINSALNHDFVYETQTPANVALIIGAGVIAWLLSAFLRRPVLRLFLLIGILVAFVEAAQLTYNHLGILAILLGPVLTITTSSLTWAAWEQVIDRRERQRTRRALERYLGQDVAHEVMDNPTSYLNALVGERREITILFSDVRGFTTLTETADAHALVTQLNEYFEAMVAIVYANRGTLDKFIGDAVMAHWGSIVSEGAAADAHRAINTVLQMRHGLARLNTDWKQRGIQEMHVGFGVNQGEAIVGNLGSEAKMEVSVIGDAVNLGSRLEGVTKQYHLDLCIGENVANLVRDSFVLRSVDLIVVKGKTKPVEVFTVIGKTGIPIPPWLPVHEDAVRMYRLGDFAAAAVRWKEVLAVNPDDGLSEVFLARCEELQKDPLEAGWSGVYEMKSK